MQLPLLAPSPPAAALPICCHKQHLLLQKPAFQSKHMLLPGQAFVLLPELNGLQIASLLYPHGDAHPERQRALAWRNRS